MDQIKFDIIIICDSAFFSEDKAPVLIRVFDDIKISSLPAITNLSAYIHSKGDGEHTASFSITDPNGKKTQDFEFKISFGNFSNHNQILNNMISLEKEGVYTFTVRSGDEVISKELKVSKINQ